MKYQKILSMLVALTGFSVFSGANAGTYTPLAASPTQVVTQSFTTVAKSVNYHLTFRGSSAPVMACLLVPLYPTLSGNTLSSLVPVIANGRNYNTTCAANRPINYSGVSPVTNLFGQDSIVPGSVRMTSSKPCNVGGYDVPILGQGYIDANVYYYAFHTVKCGAGGATYTVSVSKNLPYITVPGTYYWHTGGEQGIGVPREIGYMSWQNPNFVNNVNTQTLNINGQSWNIACDITEQCNSQKISDIKNASSPAQVNTVNFSYTSTTAGSTCPAGFHGNLKYWKSNAPSFTPMTPGSGYSVTIATGEEIHIYYDVPKSPVACTLSEQITVNVSLP
ncbi:TPA: hypothetical protein ACJINV_001979 [Escherichia coli]